MSGWLLGVVLWLAFNASLLFFAWLLFRDEPADRRDDWTVWEAELSRSARETSMRHHPAGRRDFS